MKQKIIIILFLFLYLVGCTTMRETPDMQQPQFDPIKTSALVFAIAGGAFLLIRGFENELGKGFANNFAP